MNDDKFRQHIKDTFDEQVPDVLNKIKASPDFYVAPKPSFGWQSLLTKKAALSMMSIFVVALLVVVVMIRNNEPVVASTITMEVNPSIQITLDEDDIVISVTALNDDGDEIVQRNIQYLGMTLDEVLDVLVARLQERGYIITTTDDNNIILIEVEAQSESVRTRVEAALRTKLENKMDEFGAPHWVLNARDIPLTDTQRNQMMDDMRLRMYTRAKMTLIYRIHELDNSYTIEELLPLPVRELYDLFISLEDPDNLPDYDDMPGHHPPHGALPMNPDEIPFSA